MFNGNLFKPGNLVIILKAAGKQAVRVLRLQMAKNCGVIGKIKRRLHQSSFATQRPAEAAVYLVGYLIFMFFMLFANMLYR